MTAPTRRPKFLPGTIEAMKEKNMPRGFDTVTCFFCTVTALNAEFVAHHEVPWCVIENIVANDYEMQLASEDEREERLWAQMPYTRWETQELGRKAIATLRAEVRPA